VKIIHTGVIPEPQKPWWDGSILECTFCHCTFQVEDGDSLMVGTYSLDFDERGKVTAKCPTCKKDVVYVPGVTPKAKVIPKVKESER
jgi:hypothetical protein